MKTLRLSALLLLCAGSVFAQLQYILPSDDDQTRRIKMNANFDYLLLQAANTVELGDAEVIVIPETGQLEVRGSAVFGGNTYLVGLTTANRLDVTNVLTVGNTPVDPLALLHVEARGNGGNVVAMRSQNAPHYFVQAVGTNYWEFKAVTPGNNATSSLLRFEYVGDEWTATLSGGSVQAEFNVGRDTDGVFSWPASYAGSNAMYDVDRFLGDVFPGPASFMDPVSSTPAAYSGYLPAGLAGNYPTGLLSSAVVASASPVLEGYINNADRGILSVLSGATPRGSFDLGDVAGYPDGDGWVTIRELEAYQGVQAWQRGLIRVTTASLPAGYTALSVIHELPSLSRTNVIPLFYDNGAAPSLSAAATITSGSAPVELPYAPGERAYISGVRYFTQYDTLGVSFTATNLFRNTYPAVLAELTSPVLVPKTFDLATEGTLVAKTNATGVPWFNTTYRALGTPVYVATNPFAAASFSHALALKSTIDADVSVAGTQNRVLITTVPPLGPGTTSTRTEERFFDEKYRLPASFDFTSTNAVFTNVWSGAVPLVNGEAQQFPGGDGNMWLVYPTNNFHLADWRPTQEGVTRDYSGFSGAQRYYRAFVTSTGRYDIVLHLGGADVDGLGSDGAGDYNVDIRLPGAANDWLDAGKSFGDGNGCSIEPPSYDAGLDAVRLRLGFGGRTTARYSGRLYVRVTLLEKDARIREIVSDWQ